MGRFVVVRCAVAEDYPLRVIRPETAETGTGPQPICQGWSSRDHGMISMKHSPTSVLQELEGNQCETQACSAKAAINSNAGVPAVLLPLTLQVRQWGCCSEPRCCKRHTSQPGPPARRPGQCPRQWAAERPRTLFVASRVMQPTQQQHTPRLICLIPELS